MQDDYRCSSDMRLVLLVESAIPFIIALRPSLYILLRFLILSELPKSKAVND